MGINRSQVLKYLLVMIIGFLMVSISANAGEFDGSKTLICATIDIVECQPGGNCAPRTNEEANIPYFITVDFKKKKMHATHAGGAAGRSTEIERMETVENLVLIQGAESGIEAEVDGLGWTLAIVQETGNMTLTASGEKVGFVIFGACTPK
ncbi:MAG: hypothetical protein QNI95_07735 [Desulfobacterales bacterium]|nr:hypothetical protein [Desulfobacterales bacterium]